jgi:hypothetical protein
MVSFLLSASSASAPGSKLLVCGSASPETKPSQTRIRELEISSPEPSISAPRTEAQLRSHTKQPQTEASGRNRDADGRPPKNIFFAIFPQKQPAVAAKPWTGGAALTFDPEAELGGRGAVLADEAAEEAARHGEASRPLPGPRGRRHRRPLSSSFPPPSSSKSPRRRLQLRPSSCYSPRSSGGGSPPSLLLSPGFVREMQALPRVSTPRPDALIKEPPVFRP